jgi:hypothetical protein
VAVCPERACCVARIHTPDNGPSTSERFECSQQGGFFRIGTDGTYFCELPAPASEAPADSAPLGNGIMFEGLCEARGHHWVRRVSFSTLGTHARK